MSSSCSWLVILDSLASLYFLLRDGIYEQDMVGDAYSFHVHKLFTTLSMRNIKYLVCLPLETLSYDYKPYGIDSPIGTTGRFTNGRTVIDIISNILSVQFKLKSFHWL